MNATRALVLFALIATAIALFGGGLRAEPMMPDTLPGLQLWLKADALGLADGAPVGTWTDSSSAGHDAIADASGSFVPPTFSATGIGDLPAVHFSQSAAELMEAANVFGDTAVTDGTIVALYRVDSNDERGRPVGFGANTGDGLMPNRHWNLAPDPSLRFDGSNIGSGNYTLSHPVDKYVIRSSLKSGQDFEEYFNGQLALPAITHGASLNVIDEFFLGDLHAAALPPGVTNSDVAEVVVFDRVLSAAERQGVEEYLQAKYFSAPPYWRFENGTAGQPDPGTPGNVLDQSAFADNGTAKTISGSLPTYSSDVPNAVVPGTGAANTLSLDFEADNRNYVEMPNDASLSFGDSPFTLEGWVKLETLGSNSAAGRQYAMIKKAIGQADSQMEYALMAARGNLSGGGTPQSVGLSLGTGSGFSTIVSDLEINDNDWHYLSAAFDPDADQVRFVLDFEVDYRNTTVVPAANNGPVVLGAHFNSAGNIDSPFDGLMDEIRVSRGVLPMDQLLFDTSVTRGYWRFGNGTAGLPDPGTPGNVLDSTPLGNHGTAMTISGSLPTYSADVPNAVVPGTGAANTLSLDFEADNRNYVEIPHDSSLSFGNSPYTLEAWVKLETAGQATTAGRQYVMIKKTIGDADGFMDYALVAGKGNLAGSGGPDNVGLLFGRGTGNPDFTAVFSDLKISDNQWHYLSAAFDPATGEVRFAVDYNVDVQTTTATPGGRNTGSLVLGAHFNASSVIDSPFDGLIDEVRVSPGVLGMDALLLTGFNDTRGYWRFENGAAGQPDPGTPGNVLDSSGFANHGTAMTGSGPLPAYSAGVPNAVVPATGQPNTLSLDFERDDHNYVAIPGDPSLSFADDNGFTLEAFVKLETVGNTNGASGRQYVLLKKRTDGAADSQMNYGLMAGPGNIAAADDPTSLALLLGQGTGGSSWTTVESDLQITDTEWHYISAAFDPAQDLVRFVLDDAVDFQTTTFSPGVNGGPLVIGAHFNSSGVIDSAFDGLIDEVRVSPGFLALDQLLNSRAAAAVPEPATLVLAALGALGLLWIRRRTK